MTQQCQYEDYHANREWYDNCPEYHNDEYWSDHRGEIQYYEYSDDEENYDQSDPDGHPNAYDQEQNRFFEEEEYHNIDNAQDPVNDIPGEFDIEQIMLDLNNIGIEDPCDLSTEDFTEVFSLHPNEECKLCDFLYWEHVINDMKCP